MRIVGGRHKGRALSSPKSQSTRPTSDRVREAMFNILAHSDWGAGLEKARVIDLFAGTGALGLEALSRGAGYCLFVEISPEARALIRKNIEAMGLMGVTRIFRRDATDIGPAGNMDPYDIAFLDPPYGQGLGEQALVALRDGKWLAQGGLVVYEEHASSTLVLPDRYQELDQRTWGDTQAVFARLD